MSWMQYAKERADLVKKLQEARKAGELPDDSLTFERLKGDLEGRK